MAKAVMIVVNSVGAYSKKVEGKEIRRKLYKDKYGFYIKGNARGCYSIADQTTEGWEIETTIPGEIATFRRNNHSEENAVKE